MPFDYDRITRPSTEEDPEAVKAYKAAAEDLTYHLIDAGVRSPQIHNLLRAHFDAASGVLAEHLKEMQAGEPDTRYAAGLYAAEVAITPLPDAGHCQCFRCPKCPCKPDYCNACHPEEN